MAKFVLSAFADEAGNLLSEQIAALKENEIDYIELRMIDAKSLIPLSEDELKNIKAEFDKNGIKVNSYGSPIGKYPIEDPFENHLADFEKALRICEIFETKNMRMFSFFVSQDKLEEKRSEVLKRLDELVKIASLREIRLCHENESEIYGQMPKEVSDILTSVEGLYGVFDAANYRMNNADVIEGINATLIRLGYVHIKDAVFAEQAIVPAGEGEGRIAEILDIVDRSTNETVFLTLEPHLRLFGAYSGIDKHELKGRHEFKNNRESFNFAANALKALLRSLGFERNCNNEWIR